VLCFIRSIWYFTTKNKVPMNLIGEKIRKIREIKGFSQEYMASRLKMSQNNYSRIELDQNNITLSRLEEIANVLEVKPSDIVEFDTQYVLHNTWNNQTGGESKGGVFHNDSIVKELKEHIAYLQEENKRLVAIIEKSRLP
jgi:transcriptional regulator with XRE-family HTH domain